MKFIKKIVKKFLSVFKRVVSIFKNFMASCRKFGFIYALKKYVKAIIYKLRNKEKAQFFDVMFINGCTYNLPHPIRYRVDHQIEQLESQGLSCIKVDFWNLSLNDAFKARTFIIFRAVYDDNISNFIDFAKSLNKKVIYDIDDLVIDTKYTDKIPYVQNMPKKERELYDDGVKRVNKTLLKCGSAITTTEALANELKHYVDEVFINRNVASIQMSALSEEALKNKSENSDIKIGYFSGSITHNDDINYILPVLKKVLESRSNVRLCFVGHADVPSSLSKFKSRIEFLPFTNWENLPNLISSVDINIAPLCNSAFNEAKSENKWLEASLVKVPTVASNIGAFKHSIDNESTGILCDSLEDWYGALISLIDDEEKRSVIGNNAYNFCNANYITIFSGKPLCDYIKNNRNPNCVFLMHDLDNTGGCMIIKKHASILQNSGVDVSLAIIQKNVPSKYITEDTNKVPVFKAFSDKNHDKKNLILADIDKAVTTFWVTNNYLKYFPKVNDILYLVQGYEVDFNDPGDPIRIKCAKTYNRDNISYITVSKWCQKWLKDRFKQNAAYAPNCIDSGLFKWKTRNFKDQKIRVLIEGDCIAPNKNIDEAFNIANKLDRDKFEVWYLSYGDRKKSWYKIDKFISNIPHNEVPDVYENCHILLKTSLAESFSYPPLEMMATGGYVVAIPNDGNIEYLKDKYNCLMFKQGQIDVAVEHINNIANDKNIRKILEDNSKLTIDDRKWENHTKDIVKLYSC